MAKSKDTKETPVPVSDENVVNEVSEAVEVVKESTSKANVALVTVNGRDVRKYTLKSHGSEFSKLAEEFASHTKGAEVKLVLLEKGVICPACGHEFHP